MTGERNVRGQGQSIYWWVGIYQSPPGTSGTVAIHSDDRDVKANPSGPVQQNVAQVGKEDKKKMQQTGRAGNAQHKKEKNTTKRALKLELFCISTQHRKQQLKENPHNVLYFSIKQKNKPKIQRTVPGRHDQMEAVHKWNTAPAQNNVG